MAKTKGRARQFADWEEKPVADHDPEALDAPSERDGAADANSGDESADENAGTEHYASVGQSRLRRKEQPALGPQYRGARVSRDALLDDGGDDSEGDDAEEEEASSSSASGDYEDAREGFDDPEEADLERDAAEDDDEDADIPSDNAFGESDDEKFKKFTFRGSSQVAPVKGRKVARPTAADFLSDEVQGEESSEEADEEDEEDDDDDDEEDSENPMFDQEAEETDDDEREGRDDDLDGDSEEQDSDEDSDEDGVEGVIHGQMSSGSEDEDEQSDDSSPPKAAKSSRKDKGAQGSTNGNGPKSVADSLQNDISKGVAIRRQRQSFETILNIRIRLQKAIAAANSFHVIEDDNQSPEAYEAAEAAAVRLWNSIDTFRSGMQPKAGGKRKRTIETTTSSEEIWDSMQSAEREAVIHRRDLLDTWDTKVRPTRAQAPGGRQDKHTKQPKLEKAGTSQLSLLDDHLRNTDREIKTTRVPGSCAPVQLARKVAEDPDIYNDADFYQHLLRELVQQRSADTSSAAAGGQAATVRHVAVATREAKTKKQVDTRASKGRKMRFNVHERLQNFAAPEDRRGWEQPAIDRLFGTLFGQRLVLEEEDGGDGGAADEVMEDARPEVVEGLRLF